MIALLRGQNQGSSGPQEQRPLLRCVLLQHLSVCQFQDMHAIRAGVLGRSSSEQLLQRVCQPALCCRRQRQCQVSGTAYGRPGRLLWRTAAEAPAGSHTWTDLGALAAFCISLHIAAGQTRSTFSVHLQHTPMNRRPIWVRRLSGVSPLTKVSCQGCKKSFTDHRRVRPSCMTGLSFGENFRWNVQSSAFLVQLCVLIAATLKTWGCLLSVGPCA